MLIDLESFVASWFLSGQQIGGFLDLTDGSFSSRQTLTFANTQAHAHKQTHSDCEIVWFPCLHVYV